MTQKKAKMTKVPKEVTITLSIMMLVIIGGALYLLYNPIFEPKLQTYIDWDAWEKAKEDCHKDVREFIKNTSPMCNPNTNECELHKLKYDSLYWRAIVCSDNVKIDNFERIK